MAHLRSGMLELCRAVPVSTEKRFWQSRQRKGWGFRLALVATLKLPQ